MTLLVWDAKYTLHIAEIDQQHQKLFALFNELYEAMQQGHANEVIGTVLASVVEYTAYHFATEEKLLRQYGYPDEGSHRAEHAKLIEQTNALVRKLQTDQSRVTMATLKFLSEWLNNHILGTDSKFAAFLVGKGVR